MPEKRAPWLDLGTVPSEAISAILRRKLIKHPEHLRGGIVWRKKPICFDVFLEGLAQQRINRSGMLPTRAESAANTQRLLRANSGRKCFATSAGPITLIANASASQSASNSRKIFLDRPQRRATCRLRRL